MSVPGAILGIGGFIWENRDVLLHR